MQRGHIDINLPPQCKAEHLTEAKRAKARAATWCKKGAIRLRNSPNRAQDQHKPGQSDVSLDLESVLASVQETAYRWEIGSGAIAFAANAASVLGVPNLAPLKQAKAFALLIDPEHAAARYETVTGGRHGEPSGLLSRSPRPP